MIVPRLMMAVLCGVGLIVGPATTAELSTKPSWPDNGIAQRELPSAGLMFVENDHGTLHAWVLEDATGPRVRALDFFSGRQVDARVELEDDGHQDTAFTGPDGKFHSGRDSTFRHSGLALPIELPGLDFDGGTVSLKGARKECYVQLTATVSRGPGIAGAAPGRFLVYHTMGGPKECPSGLRDSSVTSALDLDDGTFLAAEGCFVFRLRRSDLSPAGSAPALRAVDRDRLKAVLDSARTRSIQDPSAYLTRTLGVPISADLSCK